MFHVFCRQGLIDKEDEIALMSQKRVLEIADATGLPDKVQRSDNDDTAQCQWLVDINPALTCTTSAN
jgi:hypothetical protein